MLPIYQEKDFAKKNLTAENYILSELKKVSEDPKLLNELMEYEKNFYESKIVRNILKDEEVSSNTNQFFYKLYSNNDEELLRNEVFFQTNTANSTELKVKLLEEGNRNIDGNYKSRLKFISTIE